MLPYNQKYLDGKSIINDVNDDSAFGRVIGKIHRNKSYIITNWKYNENTNNFEQFKSEKAHNFLIDIKESSVLFGKLLKQKLIGGK